MGDTFKMSEMQYCGKAYMRQLVKGNINSNNHAAPRDKARETPPQECLNGDYVPFPEYMRGLIKTIGKGKKNFAVFYALRCCTWMGAQKVFPELNHAFQARADKLGGTWQYPVWSGARFSRWDFNDFNTLHACHISSEDKTQIAFTPDEGKLLTDKQVRMKPGKYLMRFFGPESANPVLTENECREWAEKHLAISKPVTLQFVPNTDPDGWEWVYENSPESCMRYNRHGRHLNYELHGSKHPVRAYAHKGNDLALAYVMLPGVTENRDENCDPSSHTVAARAIVNVANNTWLRVYFENSQFRTALEDALRAAGYSHCSSTTNGQKLRRTETDDGNLVCPYLDGDQDSINDCGDYLQICQCGDYSGCNASGYIECASGEVCPCCDNRVDEDDMHYVEDRGESICESCLNDNYTYAWVSSRNQDYISNDDVVEFNGEYYSRDEFNKLDDMCSLENGDLVCCEHTAICDATDEIHLDDDMVETEHDGTICNDYAVTCLNGEEAYVERCYKIHVENELGQRTYYIHMQDMETDTAVKLFRRRSDLLVPVAMGGDEITESFAPINVVAGSECDYAGAHVIIQTWEFPDPEEAFEMSFVGPMQNTDLTEVRI